MRVRGGGFYKVAQGSLNEIMEMKLDSGICWTEDEEVTRDGNGEGDGDGGGRINDKWNKICAVAYIRSPLLSCVPLVSSQVRDDPVAEALPRGQGWCWPRWHACPLPIAHCTLTGCIFYSTSLHTKYPTGLLESLPLLNQVRSHGSPTALTNKKHQRVRPPPTLDPLADARSVSKKAQAPKH